MDHSIYFALFFLFLFLLLLNFRINFDKKSKIFSSIFDPAALTYQLVFFSSFFISYLFLLNFSEHKLCNESSFYPYLVFVLFTCFILFYFFLMCSFFSIFIFWLKSSCNLTCTRWSQKSTKIFSSFFFWFWFSYYFWVLSAGIIVHVLLSWFIDDISSRRPFVLLIYMKQAVGFFFSFFLVWFLLFWKKS